MNKTGPWINVYAGPMISDVVYRREQLWEKAVLTRRHLDRMRRGGIDATLITATDFTSLTHLLGEVEESDGQIALAADTQQVVENTEKGMVSLLLCGCYDMIKEDAAPLKTYQRLGMRVFSLSHNRRNVLTDGCGARTAAGLSYLGQEVVKELNRLHVLVDVSHMSEAGFYDVLDMTAAPVIATHSNARALCDHPRNLTDDQLYKLAANGGITCLNFYRDYLNVDGQNASLEDLLDHIDYIARLVGIEHIGLGPDFMDAPPEIVGPALQYVDPTGEHGLTVEKYMKGPRDIEDNSKFVNVARGMQRRGYGPEEVQAVMGGNFLRLLKEVNG
ncbi:MAG: membrane dipeptidase [Anaerolineales bacterium]|nr:membrane dipeptidase [Anaerolineales bacterium]